jgi:hypothetical protein
MILLVQELSGRMPVEGFEEWVHIPQPFAIESRRYVREGGESYFQGGSEGNAVT